MKEMKTLTLNGKTYDSFHDAEARERLDELEQNGAVKTVNGISPDENGNVEIPVSGGNVDQEQITTAVNEALAQAKESGEFDGPAGKDGKDGYTPVKGVDYFDGTPGKDGNPGADGYTPVKGKDYFDGEDGQDGSPGKDGADGVSPTVAVSKSGKVTTVAITDKNGTKTATINDGADGSPGSAGKDGTSVTVKSVSESTADGGSNVVTFSDGKTLTVKNGKAGAPGATGSKGEDGKTPVKGVDYYTEDDKAEFSTYIATELAKRGQLEPLYANSIEECTDQTKMYVLPDGFIYAYMRTEVEVEGGTKPAFTNLKDKAIFHYGQRYSLSGGGLKAHAPGTAIVIPVPVGVTSIVVRLKNYTYDNSYREVYEGTSADAFTTKIATVGAKDSDGITTITATKQAATTHIVLTGSGATESSYTDIIITVNEPIEYTTGSEIIVTEAFANTGHAFVPADYEDRIIALESKSLNIAKNTTRIAELESKVGIVDENAVVHNAVGSTYPTSQKPAEPSFEGYDIDAFHSWSYDILDYIDEGVNGKETVTKEILGKDASGQYDIARYTYAKREHIAWQRVNYPKLYAWKNGTTIIYSVSVSPRKNDTMYSTAYIGTEYGTVTAVNATNRSRTVGGLEFVRHESGDVKPTVIYTDKDDERNSNPSITHEGATYNRYPLGDLGANRKKLASIFIYANEHGITDKTFVSTNGHETKMCALVAARMLRDFGAEKQENNPLYKWIRDNCMLIVIPVANPYGFNYNLSSDSNGSSLGGYYNANNVNINRNYDTPGWDYFKSQNSGAAVGAYVGSENETQYIMNTMVESGAIVAMSLHGLSGTTSATRNQSKYQGQNPDGTGYNEEKLAKISSFLTNNYGYALYNYDTGVADNMPDVTAKSPSYITQCGAHGGIIEFCPADSNKNLEGFVFEMKQKVIENAYAQTINLTAMWLSDYLESKQ